MIAARGRAPRFLVRVGGMPIPIEPARVALLGRRVDMRLDDVTLSAALREVASKTGAEIAFSRDVAGLDRRVRLNVQGLTLAAALTELLFDKGLDVVVLGDDRIAIVTQAAEPPPPVATVRGTVTDSATGVGVAGVHVIVAGTAVGGTTDARGAYALPNVPPGERTLQARRLGYREQTHTVRAEDGQTMVVDFTLAPAASVLDEMVVAGSFVESSRREAPVPITTIGDAELHRPTRNRIDQLFRGDIPGVVGYDTGPFAHGLVAYVRGSASLDDSNLLKVYVDGIETPANFLVSSIDMASIERAELLRGPQASTIYGSNASGGVLLLFTKNGHRGKPLLSGSVAAGVTASDFVGGTPMSMEHRLDLAGGGEGFNYALGGSYDSFGEVVTQGDWRQAAGHARAVITQGALSIALTASLSQRVIGDGNFPALATLGIPTLSAPLNTDDHVGNRLLGATLTYAPSARWQHVLTLGQNGLDLNTDEYAPQNAFPGDTLRSAEVETDDQVTARYVTSLNTAPSARVTSTTTAGVDVTRRTHNYYQANGLADPQSGSSAANTYIQAYRVTRNTGVFAQQVLGFGNRLFLTGGVRAENNNNVGGDEGLIWAPRAGLAYTIALGERLAVKPRVSYGKSIRPPQPGQAGSAQNAFQIQRPNPNLRPEVQLGTDAGFDLDFRHGTLTLEATYFDQDAKDLIGNVNLGTPGQGTVVTTQYQNVGRVNNKGVELAVGANVSRVDLHASFTSVRSRIESLAAGYTGDQQPGDEMLYVPQRAGGGTVGIRFTPLLSTSRGRDARLELGVTYVGQRRTLDLLGYYQCAFLQQNCRGGVRDYQEILDPFTKLRVGLSHPLTRSLEGFVNVENLTNDQVGEYVTVAPSRGRTVLFGLRFGQ
jgi:outer membrane receptor protein involved in Fe transport